jgi:hypothetical protein
MNGKEDAVNWKETRNKIFGAVCGADCRLQILKRLQRPQSKEVGVQTEVRGHFSPDSYDVQSVGHRCSPSKCQIFFKIMLNKE